MADLKQLLFSLRSFALGVKRNPKLVRETETVLVHTKGEHPHQQHYHVVRYPEASFPTPIDSREAEVQGIPAPSPEETNWPYDLVRQTYEDSWYEGFQPASRKQRHKPQDAPESWTGEDPTLWFPYNTSAGARGKTHLSIPSGELPEVMPPLESDSNRALLAKASRHLPTIAQELSDADALRKSDPERAALGAALFGVLSGNSAFDANKATYSGIIDLSQSSGGWDNLIGGILKGEVDAKFIRGVFQDYGGGNASHKAEDLVDSIRRNPEFWNNPTKVKEVLDEISEGGPKARLPRVKQLLNFGPKTLSFSTHLYNRHAPVITVDRHMGAALDMALGGPGYAMGPSTAAYPHVERWFQQLHRHGIERGYIPRNTPPFDFQWALWNALRGDEHEPHTLVWSKAKDLAL